MRWGKLVYPLPLPKRRDGDLLVFLKGEGACLRVLLKGKGACLRVLLKGKGGEGWFFVAVLAGERIMIIFAAIKVRGDVVAEVKGKSGVMVFETLERMYLKYR